MREITISSYARATGKEIARKVYIDDGFANCVNQFVAERRLPGLLKAMAQKQICVTSNTGDEKSE